MLNSWCEGHHPQARWASYQWLMLPGECAVAARLTRPPRHLRQQLLHLPCLAWGVHCGTNLCQKPVPFKGWNMVPRAHSSWYFLPQEPPGQRLWAPDTARSLGDIWLPEMVTLCLKWLPSFCALDSGAHLWGSQDGPGIANSVLL